MRTSPYNVDLRKKVIEFVESGNSQALASRTFGLNPKTVSSWCNRYKTEGHYLPRKRLGAKPKVDRQELREYVESNPNLTSEAIGKKFGVTAAGARYWLNKIGFSFKKKTSPIWSHKN